MEGYGRRYGCEAKLVERCGPGGGNPLWRFRGAPEDLRRLCLAHVAGHDVAEGRETGHEADLAEARHLADAMRPAPPRRCPQCLVDEGGCHKMSCYDAARDAYNRYVPTYDK